jgi:hypothetical protein
MGGRRAPEATPKRLGRACVTRKGYGARGERGAAGSSESGFLGKLLVREKV